jgi:hypothetical protein
VRGFTDTDALPVMDGRGAAAEARRATSGRAREDLRGASASSSRSSPKSGLRRGFSRSWSGSSSRCCLLLDREYVGRRDLPAEDMGDRGPAMGFGTSYESSPVLNLAMEGLFIHMGFVICCLPRILARATAAKTIAIKHQRHKQPQTHGRVRRTSASLVEEEATNQSQGDHTTANNDRNRHPVHTAAARLCEIDWGHGRAR